MTPSKDEAAAVYLDSPTEAEAVEIVLSGNAWKECPVCLGCGMRFSNLRRGDSEWKVDQGDCLACEGKGHVLRPIYHMALAVLDLPLPTNAPPTIMRQVSINMDGTCEYR